MTNLCTDARSMNEYKYASMHACSRLLSSFFLPFPSFLFLHLPSFLPSSLPSFFPSLLVFCPSCELPAPVQHTPFWWLFERPCSCKFAKVAWLSVNVSDHWDWDRCIQFVSFNLDFLSPCASILVILLHDIFLFPNHSDLLENLQASQITKS